MSERNEIVEFLKEQLERTNYWLSFAEAKNVALIAFNIALITVLYDFENLSACSVLLLAIMLFSCGLSLISFLPKLSKNTTSHCSSSAAADHPASWLFFDDIAKCATSVDYLKEVKNNYYPTATNTILSDKLACDYASEILINSKIAKQKYLLFKWAICLDIVAVALVVLFLIVA